MSRRLVALIVLAAAGCSANPHLTGARVSGVVRYKSAPVTGGSIRLVAVGDPSRSASGAIRGDGTYAVLNAPVGQVVAVVETESARFDPAAMLALARAKGAAVNPPPEAIGPPLRYVPINKSYTRAETSPVRLVVEKGANVVDVELP
jgi:hypothetical protein